MLQGARAAESNGYRDTALLAYVNAGIHAADALCIFDLRRYAKGEDHDLALGLLAQVRGGSGLRNRLSVVLSAKDRYTYGVDEISATELKKVARAAEALVEAASTR